MSDWNKFGAICENYNEGDYVVTQFDIRRCIIKINHFGYTNNQTCIFGEYGLNSGDELLFNHPFGLNNNLIRPATQEEIDYLERVYKQHKAKVQTEKAKVHMELEKNIKCNDITKEVKITCGDVEIVINKK